MKIKILDVIDCQVEPALAEIIKPLLSYPAIFYKQGPYRKIRTEYQKCIMKKGKNSFYFPTGLLPRVLDYCKERNVPITIEGEQETLTPEKEPSLIGITLREEQLRQVKKGIKAQRGVLVAGTGIGKTEIGLAIISAFPKATVLWLCHTKDLMYQSAERAKERLGLKKVGFIGDGKNDLQKITMATRQSFIKYAVDIGEEFDIVVIDETHHLSSELGQYSDLLKYVFAPVRIGLTATMPKDKQALLAIEGLLGPIIDQVTIKEGQQREIMADIKIRFLKVPINHSLRELRRYADVYAAGVVENNEQHKIIIETAKKHVSIGDSVLILVTQIQHGENILDECGRQNVKAVFAQGATEGAVRMEIKNALNEKKIHCVIATTIWREGLNIPELNVIINAAGGKSEIVTLQAVGRGLRLTTTKRELILYDLVNLSHNFLISHLGERLSIYTEMGWLQ